MLYIMINNVISIFFIFDFHFMKKLLASHGKGINIIIKRCISRTQNT